MNARVLSTIAATALLTAAFGPRAFAQDDEVIPATHARISQAEEQGLVRGQGDDDWSYAALNSLVMVGDTIWADEQGSIEVELPGGAFVRLADGSRLDVAAFAPRTVLKAATGSFYVQRLREAAGAFVIETPVSSVHVTPDSLVRVDVVDDGATTVTVRFGQATVIAGQGEPQTVSTGARTFVDPGLLPSAPQKFDASREDDFDAWNRERSRAIANVSTPAAITASTASSDSAPLGVSDLQSYGEWVRIDGEWYWKPTRANDYVPYRNGSWSYVPTHGYVWVGQEPFSYVTSHYGYWSYHNRHGWIWYYTPVYAPARVASVRYGDYFVWSPLDRYGKTYYHGSNYFTAGGIRFSFGYSSYAFSSHVTVGYAPCYPLYSYHVSHYRPAQVYYWNIHHYDHHYYHNHYYGHHHGHHYAHHHDYNNHHYYGHQRQALHQPRDTGTPLPPRDYAPTRVMRGRSTNANAVAASTRATRLGNSHRVVDTASNVPQRPTNRTAITDNGRRASVRNVRLGTVPAAVTGERTTRGNPSAIAPSRTGTDRTVRGTAVTPEGVRTTRGNPSVGRGQDQSAIPTRPSSPRVTSERVTRPNPLVSTPPSGGERKTRSTVDGNSQSVIRPSAPAGTRATRGGLVSTQIAPSVRPTAPSTRSTRIEVPNSNRTTRGTAPNPSIDRTTRSQPGSTAPPSVGTRSQRSQPPNASQNRQPRPSYVAPPSPSRTTTSPRQQAPRVDTRSQPRPSYSAPPAPSRRSSPSYSSPSSRGSSPSVSGSSSRGSSRSTGGSSRGGSSRGGGGRVR